MDIRYYSVRAATQRRRPMDMDKSAVVEGFPPLSHATLQLLRSFADADVGLLEIAKIVGQDPALAASVISKANSPLFSSRFEVTDILQAVVMLGADNVRSIALSVGFRTAIRVEELADLIDAVWRHSVAAALVARNLAGSLKVAEPGEAYTAGLLHDLGVVGIASADPEGYRELVAASSKPDFQQASAERGRYGIDSRTAGGWLAEAWALPESFTCAMSCEMPQARQGDICALVHVSSELADAHGFGLWNPDESDPNVVLERFSFENLFESLPPRQDIEQHVEWAQ